MKDQPWTQNLLYQPLTAEVQPCKQSIIKSGVKSLGVWSQRLKTKDCFWPTDSRLRDFRLQTFRKSRKQDLTSNLPESSDERRIVSVAVLSGFTQNKILLGLIQNTCDQYSVLYFNTRWAGWPLVLKAVIRPLANLNYSKDKGYPSGSSYRVSWHGRCSYTQANEVQSNP